MINPSCSVYSPRHDPILADNLPHIGIPLPLHHAPEKPPPNTRMPTAHLLHLGPHVAQIRRQEPRPHAPDPDPVRLELVVPVEHEHVERRLAAAVRDGLEVDRLGPPGRLRRRGEVGPARLGDAGEAGDEDQTGVGRREQERHEGPRQDLRAGDVDVIGFGEAVAEGHPAGDEFRVEGGPFPSEMSVSREMK